MSRVWRRMGAPESRTRAPRIHPAAPRNHCGHGERPSSHLAATWIGAQTRNSRTIPPIRPKARAFSRAPLRSAVAVERDAVQLHTMVDEAESELLGDALLQ